MMLEGRMSDRELFEEAIEIVLAHEGGFVNDPLDRGGKTKFGISQRAHPDVDIASLTREEAIELYWHRYWSVRPYGELPHDLALKTFDLAINMGERPAVRCLQRALLAAAGTRVTVDGLLGPQTCGAASAIDSKIVLAALRSEAAGEYRLITARDGSQVRFLRGWLERAYS